MESPASITKLNKPHAVCIPFPAQGHINPMTKLARLLHHRGFHITFVHTKSNYRRLLRASRIPHSADRLPSFSFETIPGPVLPSSHDVVADDSTRIFVASVAFMDRNSAAPFREILKKLASSKHVGQVPPVTCILSDGTLSFPLKVAEEMGISNVQLWTASVSGLLAYAHSILIENGLLSVPPVKALDTALEGVAPPFTGMRLEDMPITIRRAIKDKNMLNFVVSLVKRVQMADAVIFNTFEALEGQFLSSLATTFPPLYPCGPLQLLLDQIYHEDETLSLMGSNLWKEDHRCIEWLDSKPPASVIYVNFGSTVVLTPEQIAEIAWGLANSGKAFLWVIKTKLLSEKSGSDQFLPPTFMTKTKERGFLASWCDQERILKHVAIGGFFTHSGWNSTLESIVSGVSMICWPVFSEQQTNCWYCCELKIAIKIENKFQREKIAKHVKDLMENEGMRGRVMAWKKLAHDTVAQGSGDSWSNFDRLINHMLSSPKKIVSRCKL